MHFKTLFKQLENGLTSKMYIFDIAKIQKFKKHFKTCLESNNVKHNILFQRFSLTFAEEV